MMKMIKLIFWTILIPCFLANCGINDSDYIDPRGNDYAGSASCIECHPKIYNEALKSAHNKASAKATIENVLGHFEKGHNTYIYDSDTKIVMENRNNELFQVLYKKGKEIKAYRFDIVMGAKNAQTSMFWNKEQDILYEFPLSHYNNVNNWGTSPGFSGEQPHFDRYLSIVCFECHSSHIELKNKNIETDNYFGTEIIPETFKKESIVYGIDCERCHGPAKKHAEHHRKNPDSKLAKHIVNYNSLNNDQKLTGCVICHSAGENLQTRFKFVPGNHLKDFYAETIPRPNNNDDVHGNQYGLLTQSKCFLGSKTMTCVTCHSPHGEANETISSYSKKCMSCHSEAKNNFCTTKVSAKIAIKDNCIDCHMPKKPSSAIGFYMSGKSKMSPYLLRTHKIGVFSAEE
jgi:hypothetical protein